MLYLLLLHCAAAQATKRDFTISIDGAGLHRFLHLQISPSILNASALLKWDITPDFYIDVYELDRLNFQFRIDNDQTKFIDIELPAHRASFHRLSLNIQGKSISVPFHLRYQPPSDDDRDEVEILVPSPQIEVLNGEDKLDVLSGDPFYIKIPVGNKKHLFIVNLSSIMTVSIASLYFLRTLFSK